MSTYGTALVLDVPSGSDAGPWTGEVSDLGSGLTRLVAFSPDIEQMEAVGAVLAAAGSGRAAVAEDHDEYGALWAVPAAEDGAVRTVHRRYVLNADPDDAREVAAAVEDHGTDPRTADVAGEAAAARAAALFGVDAAAMVQAERSSGSAYLALGTVGGPFPWWDALGLPWPEG